MKKSYLNEGQRAITFIAEDIYGNKVDSNNYQGKKLMIVFYRYAGCPFCNLSYKLLAEMSPKLYKQGLDVIVFFQSEREEILKHPVKYKSLFPVIADPNKIIYKKYGVESSFIKLAQSLFDIELYRHILDRDFKQHKLKGDMFLLPAMFLIGPENMIIKKAIYSQTISDQLRFNFIKEFLKKQSSQ